MPTTLNDLVNAIPFASRGDVISPEGHNAIRAALLAIATQLGGAVTGGQTVIRTFAPSFMPASVADPAWSVSTGLARNPAGGAARGWISLDLPDGARLQRLIVLAGRTGPLESPGQMDVYLQRLSVRGATSPQTLAQVSLVGAALALSFISPSGSYAPTGISLADQPAAQVVDNSEYKYFAFADLLGAPAGSSVVIYGIQVEYRL